MMRFSDHGTFIRCASKTLAIPVGIRFVSRRRRVSHTTCQLLFASFLQSQPSRTAGMALSCFCTSALTDAGTSAFSPARFSSDAQSLLSCGTWSRLVHSWPIATTVPMSCFRPLSIGQMKPTLSNHALQRTRPSRSGGNPRVSWAGSLSLVR